MKLLTFTWRQVKPCLTCSHQTAKRFRTEAYQSYLNYLEECPDESASPQDLLGEPTDFAAFILEQSGEAEIQKSHIKRVGLKIALVVIAIAAIIITCLVIYFSHTPLVVTYKEKTTIYEYRDDEAPMIRDGAMVLNSDTGEYEKFNPKKHIWHPEGDIQEQITMKEVQKLS